MSTLFGLRGIVVAALVLFFLLARPIPVFAGGCGLLSIIFGGDCVATLDAGWTDRTQIREDGKTDRVEIRQENLTERTDLEQAGMTERTELEQSGLTERARIEAALVERLSEEQTERELVNALVQQSSVDRLADASETLAILDAKSKILLADLEARAANERTQSILRTVDRTLIILVGIIFFTCAYVYRSKRKSLPEPTYWVVDEPVRKEGLIYAEHDYKH